MHLNPHLSHSLDDCWGNRPCTPSPPYTVPCRIVWASPADLSTYPNHFNLRFVTIVKLLLWDPMACLILSLTASLVMWFCMRCQQFPKHLISVASNFFSMSAINARVSQAHESTETIREPMSLHESDLWAKGDILIFLDHSDGLQFR